MKNIVQNKYLILILRLLLGGFLIYTAQAKIMHPTEFAQAIRSYEIIPDSMSMLPAIFFPWIEFFCGLFLILGLFTRSSAVLATSLLILFTLNVLIALLRGLEIDCGCGASIAGIEKVSWQKIVENSVLILFFINIIFSKSYEFALDNILSSKK